MKLSLMMVLLSTALLASNAAGGGFEFRKVLDQDDLLPDGSDTYDAFFFAALDSGSVMFNTLGSGLYVHDGSSVRTVADTDTLVPEGVGTFGLINAQSFSDGVLVFIGAVIDGQQGIYSEVGGVLQKVADLGDPVPGGTGLFTELRNPHVRGGQITFFGKDGIDHGIYRAQLSPGPQPPEVVVNEFDILPGTGNTISSFHNNPRADGEDSLYIASNIFVKALYLEDVLIADTTTLMPGRVEAFAMFERASSDAGRVVFVGKDALELIFFPGHVGLYTSAGAGLVTVAQRGDVLPGIGEVDLFGNCSVDGDTIVFHAVGVGGAQGLYLWRPDEPIRLVIHTATSLPDGAIEGLSVYHDSLDNGAFVFSVRFSGPAPTAIYVAEPISVPALGSLGSLLLCIGFGVTALLSQIARDGGRARE